MDYSYDEPFQLISDALKGAVTIAENSQTELQGDLNFDNKVSVADIVMLQKYIVKKAEFTMAQWKLADLNSDETVNVFDLVILKRKILNGN